MTERNLSLAISPKRRDRVKNVEWSWDQLIERLSSPADLKLSMADYLALDPEAQLDLKNVGYFLACYCRDGLRRKTNIEYRSAVCLDVDRCSPDILDEVELGLTALSDYEFFAHSTVKHTAEKPRLRVVLPLTRNVTPEEFEPVARLLAQKLDETMDSVDHVTYRIAQVMFWPAKVSDGDFVTFHNTGGWADPDTLLTELPDWKDPACWPQPHSRELPVTVSGRVAEDPREKTDKAPLVAAFCTAYPMSEAIDNWLSDKYEEVEATSEREMRYRWAGGSGGAGARVYDDLFMYSDHDTDPAGGHSVNAFDLVRIHLYGHLDKRESGPLTQRPSYKAMEKFCQKLEPVQAELQSIEAEYIDSLFEDLGDEEEEVSEDDVDPEIDELLGGSSEPKKPKLDAIVEEFCERIESCESLADVQKVCKAISKVPFMKLDGAGRGVLASVIQAKMQEVLGKGRKAPTRAEIKKDIWPDRDIALSKCQDMEMPAWLMPWVYLTEEDFFFNAETQEKISPRAFNVLYDDRCAEMFGYDETGLAAGVRACDVATFGFKVPCVYQMMYWPGRERVFEHNGISYVNSYRDTGAQKPKKKSKRRGLKLMKMHLENLFPEPRHRRLLIDYLAHVVQNPDKKLIYAVLIAGAETDGKSWFLEMMMRVIGETNYTVVGTDALAEKFNGYIEGKLLCGVEEVKQHGRDAYDVLNRMKAPISNSTIPIRSMGRDYRHVRNFANWFMTTNYRDAIPANDNESRYLILFTRFRRTEHVKAWRRKFQEEHGWDFYTELYEEMRNDPWQFREYLTNYEFSEDYNPAARAPRTEFMDQMIEASASEEEILLRNLLEDERYPALKEEVFDWSRFKQILDREFKGHRLNGRGVSPFMERLGFVRVTERLKYKGEHRRIWSRTDRFVDQKTGNVFLPESNKAYIREILEAQEKSDDEIFENVVNFR